MSWYAFEAKLATFEIALPAIAPGAPPKTAPIVPKSDEAILLVILLIDPETNGPVS